MRSEYVPFLLKEKAALASVTSKYDPNSDPLIQYSSETLYRNYYAMMIAFSINHGCVVTVLAYASAILGNELGSIYSGILYVVYAMTAFLLSKPLVNILGPHMGLFYGVVGYSVYVAGFVFAILFAEVFPLLSWLVACVAATIGGLAGGLLWISQGRYFTQHCKLFSETTNINIEIVTTDFAGIFASYFLGIELLTKIIATLIYLVLPGPFATVIIFVSYSLISAATVLMMGTLDDLNDEGRLNWTYDSISHDIGASARLIYTDFRLALLIPYQAAFGFSSSFVPYYIFGTIVNNYLGYTWVGILSAVVVLSGVIASSPSSKVALKFGKPAVIILGSTALILTSGAFFIFSDEQLGTWPGILILLTVYGVGRGIWENTNKAVLADFYAGDRDAATSVFAATSFANGYAGAMGYFTFPYMSRSEMSGICLMSGIIGLICYLFAFRVNATMMTEKSIDKKTLLRSKYYDHMEKVRARSSFSAHDSDSHQMTDFYADDMKETKIPSII